MTRAKRRPTRFLAESLYEEWVSQRCYSVLRWSLSRVRANKMVSRKNLGRARKQPPKHLPTASGCGISIAFQSLASSYVPSGYESTTGVYPACQNVPPATNCLTDPCRAQVLQPRLPIFGEIANCSVKFNCGGQEHDINCDQQVAPSGKYFVTVGWSFGPGKTKNAPPTVKAVSETADLPK